MVTNIQVCVETIQIHKIKYLVRNMRNAKYRLLHLALQGKMGGRRQPGRSRIS